MYIFIYLLSYLSTSNRYDLLTFRHLMNFDENFRSKKSSKSLKFDDFYIKIIDFDENFKKKVACGAHPSGRILEWRASHRRPAARGLNGAKKSVIIENLSTKISLIYLFVYNS